MPPVLATVNSSPALDTSGERLKSFIERVERLEEEKKGIADDIRDVYAEAKGTGFDPKIMRQIVRLRKLDSQERQEQDALRESYMSAIGMTIKQSA